MSLSAANHAVQLIARLLQTDTATEPICDFGPQKPPIPAGQDSRPLPRATPEAYGVSSRRVAAFLEALRDDPTLRMHSVLLLRGGHVFCEAAFGPRDTKLPRHTFSACKSVTVLAVGLLMDDGLLSPDDKVVDFFPEACGAVSRRIFKDLTVEDLLTMRASVLFNEAGSMTRPDWVRAYFSVPGLSEQGKRFQYNSLNTYILSADFLRRATQAHVSPPSSLGDYDYGWQLWVGRKEESFLFNGMLGQNVLGLKRSGILLVSHAGNDETYQQSRYFALARQFFDADCPDALPRDGAGTRALQRTLEDLRATPGRLPRRGEAEPFLGRRFVAADPDAASTGLVPLLLQAVENCYTPGLEAVSLGGTAQAPELFYEERDAVYHLAVGLEAPVRQSLLFRGNAFLVAVQGRFTHDDEENPVLRIQIDFLETPSTRILKLILTPQGPRLTQDETPGAAFVTAMADDMGESAAFRALATALVGTPDPAYLRYRIGRMFRPDLALTAEALE